MSEQLRNFIVGGTVAGVISGLIVAGAIVATSPGSGGAIEVHGTVGIDGVVQTEAYEQLGGPAQPIGSSQFPFVVVTEGVTWVKDCGTASGGFTYPPAPRVAHGTRSARRESD
jgi:hypothetical protein